MRCSRFCVVTFLVLALGACSGSERQAYEAHNEGINLLSQKQVSRAVKQFETATKLKPDLHQSWYQLGGIHLQQKKFQEAGEALSEAVKYESNDAMYHMQLGQSLYEGFETGEGGSLDLAQSSLEKAIELNPKLYRAHWYLGRVYNRKDMPAEAASAWTQAAQLNPLFGRPFSDLGKLYLRWDFNPQAIAVLEQGSLHVKDPKEATYVFYNLGLAYDAQKNWDKAIEAYTNALAKRKDNADARLQRAFSYYNKGEKSKARADLEEYTAQRKGNAGLELDVANELLMRIRM